MRSANTYIGPINLQGGGTFSKIDKATVANWREAERVAREGAEGWPVDLKYANRLRATIARGEAWGIVADDAKLWPEIQHAETATRS